MPVPSTAPFAKGSITTAVSLTGGTATPVRYGVLVAADSANTDAVYVGLSTVTTANGVPIYPGQSRWIPVSALMPSTAAGAPDAANLYLVAGSGTQAVRAWVDVAPESIGTGGGTGSGGAVTVASGGYTSSVAITRPNDTNAYLAGDVIGTTTSAGGAVLTFSSAGPSGGHVMVTDSQLMIAASAVISGMTSFTLQLYSATPPSNLGDSDPWDLPSGDRSAYLGYVALGTIVDVGSTLFVQSTGVNRKFKLASSSTTLYGYLVTVGAFTPAASTVFTPLIGGVGL